MHNVKAFIVSLLAIAFVINVCYLVTLVDLPILMIGFSLLTLLGIGVFTFIVARDHFFHKR